MSETLWRGLGLGNGDCQHFAMEAQHFDTMLCHTLSSTILDAGNGPKTLTAGWKSPGPAEQREMSATQRVTDLIHIKTHKFTLLF